MARAWAVPGLRGDARFREAAGRIILTRWREMMSHREGTLLGEDIEELHAMRVSSRRLRAAMDAFEAVFPPRSFRKRLRWVKEITDTLGAARDLDVAIAGLLREAAEAPPDERPGLEGLIARHREARAREAVRVAEMFARLDERDVERRFVGWVERHTGVSMRRLKPRPPGED